MLSKKTKIILGSMIGGIIAISLLVMLLNHPLHSAAAKNDVNRVKLLLFLGFDIESEAEPFVKISMFMVGSTPLEWASISGAFDTAQLLVERGANQIGKSGAIHLASSGGHLDIVKMFLDKGVDPNILSFEYKVGSGSVPLIRAIGPCREIENQGIMELQKNRKEIIKMLLDRGANPNARQGVTGEMQTREEDGLTALHRASYNGCFEIVELLLEYGADPNLKSEGQTVMEYIQSNEMIGASNKAALRQTFDLYQKKKSMQE